MMINRDLIRDMKSLDIEISNLCNINCNFCPRDSISRPKGLMDEETFDILLDWIPQNFGVTFSGMGEPLINSNINSFIQRLWEKNIKVFLKTNGLMLSPSVYNKLIDSGIWHIQISIISGSEDFVEHGISKSGFQELEYNLKYISKKNNSPVSFSLVESQNSISNLNRAEFAKMFDIPLFISKLHSRGGELYQLKDLNQSGNKDSFCEIFPHISFISWQGDILSCCHDITGKTALGNIADTLITELEKIKKDRIESSKWFSICGHCDDEMRYNFGKNIRSVHKV